MISSYVSHLIVIEVENIEMTESVLFGNNVEQNLFPNSDEPVLLEH